MIEAEARRKVIELIRLYAEGDTEALGRIEKLSERYLSAGVESQAAEVAEDWEAGDIEARSKILKVLTGAMVLHHAYTSGGYDGSCLTIYFKAGKLYEVYGSHCSCFGLEDQWDPEETTLGAIRSRIPETLTDLTPTQAELVRFLGEQELAETA